MLFKEKDGDISTVYTTEEIYIASAPVQYCDARFA